MGIADVIGSLLVHPPLVSYATGHHKAFTSHWSPRGVHAASTRRPPTISTAHSDLQASSKWSLRALRRRLTRDLGELQAEKVWSEIDDLVVKCAIAAEPSLFEAASSAVPAVGRGEPTRGCFQVFGFDVMLDADAKPWLLEVNGDPQMTTQSPVDLRVKVRSSDSLQFVFCLRFGLS